eukprot:6881770-Pyramimonas_sp.AAC.1
MSHIIGRVAAISPPMGASWEGLNSLINLTPRLTGAEPKLKKLPSQGKSSVTHFTFDSYNRAPRVMTSITQTT